MLLCICDFIFVQWTIVDNECIKLEKGSRPSIKGNTSCPTSNSCSYGENMKFAKPPTKRIIGR